PVAPCDRSPEHPFPQLPVLQRGQQWLGRRQRQRQQVPAFVTPLPGRLGRCRDLRIGQSGQLFPIRHPHRQLVGVGQQVVRKPCGQRRQLGVQFPQPLPVGLG